MAYNGPGRPSPTPSPLAPKAKKPGRMMGSDGDSGGFNPPKGAYDYTGARTGAWKNRNGTTVGRSAQEDSTITPYKSTGDTANVRKYVSQRRAAGDKNYTSNALPLHKFPSNTPAGRKTKASLVSLNATRGTG